MKFKQLIKLLAPLVLVVGIIGVACAANYAHYFKGNVLFQKAKIDIDANSQINAVSGSTGNFSDAHIANRTRYVDLPLASFLITATGAPATTASEPGSVVANSIPALEWAQSETGKVSSTFFVPSDYDSGNTFACMFSLDAATTDSKVDFEAYVNEESGSYDAAVTNQTAVDVTNSTTDNMLLDLTLATDTFSAGDLVTFNVWRSAGTGAGSNLNLLGCRLEYTGDM